MIPLRDSLRTGRVPVVTLLLVAANVAAHVWRFVTPDAIELWGLVPARLLAAGHPRELLTIGTSMFLHADVLHLLSNIWFLWIFGDNVEERLGHARFVAFYLVSGLVAALGQVAFEPGSTVPMIGASGAVAGVLGAYLRFFPRARIFTIVPVFVFVQFMEIPALVFLGLWFVLQMVSSLLGEGGVAWWAHMAGFLAGFVLALPVRAPGHRPAARRAGRR